MRSSLIIVFMILFTFEMSFGDILDRWANYKKTFLSEDGRIIDFQNNSITHSEGQGYGMLLSLLFDDKQTFDKIWSWTKNNLMVRKMDKLFAWSWGLHPSGKWRVLDYNNATDGDTLIAYSLCLAGEKWKIDGYINEARNIISDLRELLIIKRDDSHFLLPGYYGFYKEDSLIINPSYYILPAYKVFAKYDDRSFWGKFYSDSIRLLKNLNFGPYKLPSDWIVLKDKNIYIFSEKKDTFGIEAIRIPIYAIMAKEFELIEKFRDFIGLVERIGYVPEDIDLKENRLSYKEGMAMHYIIVSSLAKHFEKRQLSEILRQKGLKKLEEEHKNYYSHTLSLIVLAMEER
ncbi:MAG: glycosyl hydrolase family 8 [Thermodesulfovibrio sp.]|nr:glycosyl hydrolase family 8 [Thermodesulfovibrio sp.]